MFHHVDLTAPALPSPSPHVPPADEHELNFDPIGYLAYCRERGVAVRAGIRDGVRWLSWDFGDRQSDVVLRHHPDPALDIDADPDNELLVWETLRAETYIAAVRSCRLLIFPWGPSSRGRCGAMIFGEETDGKYDYSAGTRRLLKHPDRDADDDCRRGLVFRVLCAQFDVEPDDPELWKKVNARRGVPPRQVVAS